MNKIKFNNTEYRIHVIIIYIYIHKMRSVQVLKEDNTNSNIMMNSEFCLDGKKNQKKYQQNETKYLLEKNNNNKTKQKLIYRFNKQ